MRMQRKSPGQIAIHTGAFRLPIAFAPRTMAAVLELGDMEPWKDRRVFLERVMARNPSPILQLNQTWD